MGTKLGRSSGRESGLSTLLAITIKGGPLESTADLESREKKQQPLHISGPDRGLPPIDGAKRATGGGSS